jgi:hypothetical protein
VAQLVSASAGDDSERGITDSPSASHWVMTATSSLGTSAAAAKSPTARIGSATSSVTTSAMESYLRPRPRETNSLRDRSMELSQVGYRGTPTYSSYLNGKTRRRSKTRICRRREEEKSSGRRRDWERESKIGFCVRAEMYGRISSVSPSVPLETS